MVLCCKGCLLACNGRQPVATGPVKQQVIAKEQVYFKNAAVLHEYKMHQHHRLRGPAWP